LRPNDANAFYGRGHANYALGRYDLAVRDYDAALRLAPKALQILASRGAAYSEIGQPRLAIADLDRAIEDEPSGYNFNDRCWARAVWGQQLDAALADCNASLKLDNTDPAAQDSRALVYFRLGKNDLAIGDASGAIAFAPGKLPSSLYVRGLARLREGNLKDGKADVAAAEKLDPDIASRYAKWGVKPADGSAP